MRLRRVLALLVFAALPGLALGAPPDPKQIKSAPRTAALRPAKTVAPRRLVAPVGRIKVPARQPAKQRLTRGNPLDLLPGGGKGQIKVVVLGAAVDEKTIDPGLTRRLQALGKRVAKEGGVLITGAAPGVPQVAARAAYEAGAVTIGVSPARSLADHNQNFKMPTESLSILELTGAGRGMGFIEREAPLIEYGDILVYANGRSGTLGELVAGMHEPKVIALLEGSGGVTAEARRKILPHLGQGKAVVVADSDPERLMRKAIAAHKELVRAGREGKAGPVVPAVTPGGKTKLPPMQRGSLFKGQAPAEREVYAFFGHDEGLTGADRTKVDQLVTLLSAQHPGRMPVLVVPTRPGLTAEVAKKAQAKGVRTLGISPARTKAEHVAGGQSVDGLGRIQLTGKGAGVGEFAAQRHVIEHANVVFVAGGDYKSLGGTIFAMYHDTVVAVLETEGGGMSGKLRGEILTTFDKKPFATMVFDSDPVRLYHKAIEASDAIRARQRGSYIAPE